MPSETTRGPSGELIAAQAKELQGVPMKAARAAELAVEVGRLNGTAQSVADACLGFFDEPAAFLVALSELRDADA